MIQSNELYASFLRNIINKTLQIPSLSEHYVDDDLIDDMPLSHQIQIYTDILEAYGGTISKHLYDTISIFESWTRLRSKCITRMFFANYDFFRTRPVYMPSSHAVEVGLIEAYHAQFVSNIISKKNNDYNPLIIIHNPYKNNDYSISGFVYQPNRNDKIYNIIVNTNMEAYNENPWIEINEFFEWLMDYFVQTSFQNDSHSPNESKVSCISYTGQEV